MTSETDDLRALVLDATLALALRAVEATRTSGLTCGQISERVQVADVEWHVKATYDRDEEIVLIDGHPCGQAAHQGPLAALFGLGAASGGGFNFRTPAAWLEGAGRPSEVRP